MQSLEFRLPALDDQQALQTVKTKIPDPEIPVESVATVYRYLPGGKQGLGCELGGREP